MNRKNYPTEIKYSWEKIIDDTRQLAKTIKRIELDTIVTIAEGGWVPSRILKNFIEAEYYSIGCDSYDKNGNKLATFKVYQTIEPSVIKNKNVLIFDEVCESGRTLKKISKLILEMQPKSIYTAVLHHKTTASLKPDFFAKSFKNKWILYPWDNLV